MPRAIKRGSAPSREHNRARVLRVISRLVPYTRGLDPVRCDGNVRIAHRILPSRVALGGLAKETEKKIASLNGRLVVRKSKN